MPTWNDIIKQYFNELMEFVKSAKSFASEQIPLYLKEMIRYELCSHILYAVVLLLVIGLCLYLSKVFRKLSEDENRYQDGTYTAGRFFCLILAFFMLIPVTANIDKAIKAAVAPRVVIVEKIQELITRGNNGK